MRWLSSIAVLSIMVVFFLTLSYIHEMTHVIIFANWGINSQVEICNPLDNGLFACFLRVMPDENSLSIMRDVDADKYIAMKQLQGMNEIIGYPIMIVGTTIVGLLCALLIKDDDKEFYKVELNELH